MKSLIFLFLSIYTIKGICQSPLLLDTSMNMALSAQGYKGSTKKFELFTAKATDDKIYSNTNLKSKITFINFWFEGCAPCIAEFDALNDLYKKYKSNKDFQFLSFTFETHENVLRVASKYHLEYPILTIEKNEIYKLIFNLGFPTSIITDRLGKISFIKCGGFSGFKEKEKNKEVVDSLYSKEIERLLYNQ